MSSIANVASSPIPFVPSNSLDAITDFGREQVDNLPEQIRVKRPDAEPAQSAGQPQITD